MQNDVITIKLRLRGLVVLGSKEWENHIEVVARYSNEEAACPRCGRRTWQVHQWHGQRKKDAKIWRKPVWLLLWKRRFRCRICRKVFTEPDPACGRWLAAVGAAGGPDNQRQNCCRYRARGELQGRRPHASTPLCASSAGRNASTTPA